MTNTASDSILQRQWSRLCLGFYLLVSLPLLLMVNPGYSAEGKQVTLTGEVMDTWCYVSQIMGPSQAVVGTTHHVCAVWCAAGGIPVGLVDKSDGKIYMILSFEGDTTSVANQKLLDLQSHELTIAGTAFELDGINYLTVDKVVEDTGIVNLTHETFGVLPFEARP
ncbi:MAG: hypothetical protein KTR18_16350 [Acidiferrobacterales bacterium]|nr:hypothetical protein [Acidiferrobacterales bacterium]